MRDSMLARFAAPIQGRELMASFPSVWRNANKQIVAAISCPQDVAIQALSGSPIGVPVHCRTTSILHISNSGGTSARFLCLSTGFQPRDHDGLVSEFRRSVFVRIL